MNKYLFFYLNYNLSQSGEKVDINLYNKKSFSSPDHNRLQKTILKSHLSLSSAIRPQPNIKLKFN